MSNISLASSPKSIELAHDGDKVVFHDFASDSEYARLHEEVNT